MFTTIDVFSGIGGNAYALPCTLCRTPAVYCEIDPDARALLRRAMANGFVPTAPIHDDVCTLMQKKVYKDAKARRPLLVSGSWPCQGASALGKRKGMDDPRSGLLRNLCAIVLDARPEVAVFENVPEVINNGSVAYIFQEVGEAYHVRHTLVRASDFGYGHDRKRFYAVLVRRDFEVARDFLSPEPFRTFMPPKVEPPRTVPQRSATWSKELKALGNSIVPACMYYVTLQALGFPVPVKRHRQPLNLVLDPAAYAPPPGTVLAKTHKAEGVLDAPVVRNFWATPRTSSTHACHVLTRRASRDLATMVRFERDTPERGRTESLNPDWVRHLMGFPRGYLVTEHGVAYAAGKPPARAPSSYVFHGVPEADVVFTCHDGRFAAHAAVLRAKAPGLADALAVASDVASVGPNTMARILAFVYTEVAPEGLSAPQMERFERAAKLFKVAGL